MKQRYRAALVISRRQSAETLLSPGFYVSLSAGLVLGWLLVGGYAASVGSGGFDPSASPAYSVIGKSIVSVFGAAFAEKLFAEGPFAFALLAAFAPAALFIAASSVLRFAQEKASGAIELIAFGPADGGSYIIASFLRDAAFSALSLAAIAAFFAALAAWHNMALGPLFLAELPALLFSSLALFAYGSLCSSVSANASSALAAFAGIAAAFLLLLIGSSSAAVGSLRDASRVASALLGWVSPFQYAALGLGAAEAGKGAAYALCLLASAVLAGAALAGSHLALRRKGLRP